MPKHSAEADRMSTSGQGCTGRNAGWIALAGAIALSACNGAGPAAPPTPALDEQAPPSAPASAMRGRELPMEGGLVVSQPWIRAPLPSAGSAGGYLRLRNTGAADDRLIAVRSDAVERVEIHGMRQEDGMLRMRPFADGLPLPAGETVALAPGGNHLMLVNPGDAVVAGNQVDAMLVFEHAPEQQVVFDVRDSAEGPDGAGGRGDGHEAARDRAVPEADETQADPPLF